MQLPDIDAFDQHVTALIASVIETLDAGNITKAKRLLLELQQLWACDENDTLN